MSGIVRCGADVLGEEVARARCGNFPERGMIGWRANGRRGDFDDCLRCDLGLIVHESQ